MECIDSKKIIRDKINNNKGGRIIKIKRIIVNKFNKKSE
jgi:hypothetical protein